MEKSLRRGQRAQRPPNKVTSPSCHTQGRLTLTLTFSGSENFPALHAWRGRCESRGSGFEFLIPPCLTVTSCKFLTPSGPQFPHQESGGTVMDIELVPTACTCIPQPLPTGGLVSLVAHKPPQSPAILDPLQLPPSLESFSRSRLGPRPLRVPSLTQGMPVPPSPTMLRV